MNNKESYDINIVLIFLSGNLLYITEIIRYFYAEARSSYWLLYEFEKKNYLLINNCYYSFRLLEW